MRECQSLSTWVTQWMRMSHFTLLIFYQSLRSSDLSHFYNLSFNICLFFLSVFSSKILCFSSNKTLKLIFWNKISYFLFYTSKHQENMRKIELLLSKLKFIHLLAIKCVTVWFCDWNDSSWKTQKSWQISYIKFIRCSFSIVRFLWKSINFKICNIFLLII